MFRPSRLKYETSKSWYALHDQDYYRRRLPNALAYFVVVMLFPFVSVKTFNLLDRLPIWDKRVRE